MNLCSDKHDEVCYECRNCPVCEIRESLGFELDDAIKEISRLNKELERVYNAE